MKRRTFLKNSATASLLTLITPRDIFQTMRHNAQAGLEESFLSPSPSARPHCWWHWMNGNVSKEGITLDLEVMQRIGIGGFQNFDAGTGIPEGPVKYLSPEWLELKKHAIQEADRLGLEFTMHNCPGWSSSGGPWITPELSMQQLSWSETAIQGGRKKKVKLPQPFTNLGYYQDVAVLAFPAPAGEAPLQDLLKSISSNKGKLDIKQMEEANAEGFSIEPEGENQPAYLQFEFKEPYEARSLTLISSPVSSNGFGGGPSNALKLEVSDDGQQFRPLSTLGGSSEIARSREEAFMVAEFPATRAKFFRLVSGDKKQFKQIRFSGAARLDDWRKKANFRFTGEGVADEAGKEQTVAATAVIDPHSIVDLSSFVDEEGILNWKAPKGKWTILRIGFTPMGTLNRSAPDTGVGLECDKYSAEAITFHFNKMMEELLPSLNPLGKKGKVGMLIDSYEVGMQNWTPGFEKAFQKRMGYELLHFLPAMTGRVLGSVEESNRFLWDLRRAQADLMADNYYGKFTELCHENGIISYTQPYDRGPMEEMQIGSRMDINIGEFWNSLSSIFQNNWSMRRTMKLSASIAHVNGQKIVGAESFTGEPESARWQEYPFALKGLGDKKFTEGLNRVVFHRFAHQPHPTAKPGMTMGPWGIHFDRTNTWWEPGKAWIHYLTRCQSLLQQGLFMADLAYFAGESPGGYTRVEREELNPPPPEGYDYDLINGEAIQRRVKIENGQLSLPDGMRYRALVLQDPKGMTLALLRKLHALVEQGMVLIGAKPEYSLGLAGNAEEKADFERLVQALWGSHEASRGTNNLGRGSVYWRQPMEEVLESLELKPDFQLSSRSGDAPVTYIHRRDGDTHIYFLSNQRRTHEELVCTFRVKGMQPELWDADSGSISPQAVYEQLEDGVRLPVQLGPYGSVFVVFRTAAPARQLQAVLKSNSPVLGSKPFPKAPRKLYQEVANDFTISLWAKPEFNVMLTTQNFMDHIKDPWTDYYTIYPPSGGQLYGEGHATAGLAVGRNGVTVWEHGSAKPQLALSAPISITGWSHVALVYEQGAPAIYVNGSLVAKGKKSKQSIHPALGQAFLQEGASYYNGDMSEPQLFRQALSEERIRQEALKAIPQPQELPAVALGADGLLFWKDGRYTLKDNAGKERSFQVSGLGEPQVLSGPWQLSFPPKTGAPEQIDLPELMSLRKHEVDGVKYFSGTATYATQFQVAKNSLPALKNKERLLFLDLGQVEVMAEVQLNGKELGILWKRPYLLDISEAVKAGTNQLEIKVTNQWPNRLIGDEQLPDHYKFRTGAGNSSFASLSNGAIEELPEWYLQEKPQPENHGRVTFTTWKHYHKDSPLLESGLIGPVVLRTAERRNELS